jgi:hypothetical protein
MEMGYKMANFNKKKTNMNADILKGQWTEIKGEVKQKWVSSPMTNSPKGKEKKDDFWVFFRRCFAEEVWIRQGKSQPGI